MTTKTLQRQAREQVDKRQEDNVTRPPGQVLRVLARMLLDRSGSMRPHIIDVLEGAADFLEVMREQTVPTLIAFDLFDDAFDAGDLILAQQAAYLTRERYRADGDTALFDSILRTIRSAETHEAPGDKVVISIFTDGHDTCSSADMSDVRPVVLAKQAKGWIFLFAGPSSSVGTGLGIPRDNVFQLSGGDIRGVLTQVVQRTQTLLLPPAGGTTFHL